MFSSRWADSVTTAGSPVRFITSSAISASPHQSISTWVKQADRDAGKRIDGPTSAEREELGRLRRENHRLRQERDILAKAVAWFARESKASPNGFTGS
jgi:transposase-like protein